GAFELTRLDEIPGVAVHYDQAMQSLDIQAPLDLLDLDATVISTSSNQAVTLSDSRGALLNYDLYASRQTDGANLLSATNELRWLSSQGVFSTPMLPQAVDDALADTGQSARQGWQLHNVRLDTSWRSAWPQQAVTLTLGDTYTGSLSWSR